MRNWRTMAVFLGPRHTTAEEREGRSKARDIACKEPILSSPSPPPSWFVFVAAVVDGGGVVWPFAAAGFEDDGAASSLFCGCGEAGGGPGMGGSFCEGWT